VSRGLESLQAPLPLAGGLVRMLGAMVQMAVLPMFHTGQQLPLRRPIAPGALRNACEKTTEGLHCGRLA
jgi:hypothetical protein